jgi:hypothetical protein
MDPLEQVRAFAEATLLEEKWSSARQMMSSKAKPNGESFYSWLQQGLEGLGHIARSGDDTSRLVAIDLLVRLPASMKNNKRVQAMASEVRRASLSLPLPALSTISDKKSLPGSAKPAEVRENIAEALKDATGPWLSPYVFRALGDEERSQRCRLALAREIAHQEPSIDKWIERLLNEPGLQDVAARDLEAAAGRLKDICDALVEGIRTKRSKLTVTPVSGQLLAKLIRMMISLGPKQNRPKGLDLTAKAAIELLDEILAVRLTIMDEPELYDLVQVINRWWSPRSFPEIINAALGPIIDKLTAGLVFRARGGQRSEVLLQRLKQAINNEEQYKNRITEIVSSEAGLSGEIQDWIRGMERGTSKQRSSSALSAVGAESFVRQLAEMFRLSLDNRENVNNDSLQRAVRAIASQHGLAAIGSVGDIVEYSPNVYDLPSGDFPKERSVKIVRQPIVRRRHDGGSDVILKGLASAN